jgi:hypothetical protein
MDEDVLAAVIGLDEAEALHIVVELYSARIHLSSLSRLLQCTRAKARESAASARIVDVW